jgi:hypothetical protein
MKLLLALAVFTYQASASKDSTYSKPAIRPLPPPSSQPPPPRPRPPQPAIRPLPSPTGYVPPPSPPPRKERGIGGSRGPRYKNPKNSDPENFPRNRHSPPTDYTRVRKRGNTPPYTPRRKDPADEDCIIS